MKKNQGIIFVEKNEKQVPWQKAHTMEKIFDMTLVTCHKSKISVLATVEIYMGKSSSASTMHCFFRLNDNKSETYRYGYGSAGGYGYCKKSSSMASALEWAGIKLEKPINGVGEGAMREALEALAKKLKYRIFSVI